MVYATNLLTYFIGRLVVQIDSIAMVNILLEEKVIEELIQSDMNSNNIYEKSFQILSNKTKYNKLKEKLMMLKSKLGKSGASEQAAKIIYSMLNEVK